MLCEVVADQLGQRRDENGLSIALDHLTLGRSYLPAKCTPMCTPSIGSTEKEARERFLAGPAGEAAAQMAVAVGRPSKLTE